MDIAEFFRRALDECKNIEGSYGVICVKCNKCGRFDKKGEQEQCQKHIKPGK